MKLVLISTIFLTFFISKAQTTTLRVLGQYNYVEYAETNGVNIAISDKEIDVKKKLLLNKIDSLGITNNLTQINHPVNFQDKTLHFKIEEKNRNVFDQLLIVINDLQINIQKVYFKIPPHQLEDEYLSATMALKNANSQAKIVVHNLNYKIIEILNIADETTYASPIYDNIDLDSKRGRLTIKIINLLSDNSSLYEKRIFQTIQTSWL